MKTSASAALAQAIDRRLPDVKAGTLRFWGVWFGRPYDNVHRVVRATSTNDSLILSFDGGESLEVWMPELGEISKAAFLIRNANRVRWQWYYYGRPQVPENLFFQDFERLQDTIKVSTNADWGSLPLHDLDADAPAVEMF